jgi:hypothetical protein
LTGTPPRPPIVRSGDPHVPANATSPMSALVMGYDEVVEGHISG